MNHVDIYGTMFTGGGLPEGITALQRLQHLRLFNCVTAPLTSGISRLTQLTSLTILGDPFGDVLEPVAVRGSFTRRAVQQMSMACQRPQPAAGLRCLAHKLQDVA
jgi:hypothetical protein